MDTENASDRVAAMRKYMDKLLEKCLESPIDAITIDPSRIPRRELPPGKLADLYVLYVTQC